MIRCVIVVFQFKNPFHAPEPLFVKGSPVVSLEVAGSGKVDVADLALDLTRVSGHVDPQRVDTQGAEGAVRTGYGVHDNLVFF